MASFREFVESIGHDAPVISVLAIAEHCQAPSPVSVRALMEGGCIQTVIVTLHRQPVGLGTPFYTGQLNATGVLTQIAIPNSFTLVGISFRKASDNTFQDCGDLDPDTIVFVGEGTSIGEDEIAEIFGGAAVSSDQTPLQFLACVVSTSPFPDFVTFQATVEPV